MAIDVDGAFAGMEMIIDFLDDQADVIDGPERGAVLDGHHRATHQVAER